MHCTTACRRPSPLRDGPDVVGFGVDQGPWALPGGMETKICWGNVAHCLGPCRHAIAKGYNHNREFMYSTFL